MRSDDMNDQALPFLDAVFKFEGVCIWLPNAIRIGSTRATQEVV